MADSQDEESKTLTKVLSASKEKSPNRRKQISISKSKDHESNLSGILQNRQLMFDKKIEQKPTRK
jgi:hypothetical protein